MTKTKDSKFKLKQMSNPYSTGGVGPEFEKSVQSSFVVLLLSGGIFPALSSYPIVKIELQNRIRGVYTDDLTIYTGKDSSKIYNKMFAQIKRDVAITSSNNAFKETLESAWLDYNGSLFNRERDKIALITTPLSKTDSVCIKILLDYANEVTDINNFKLKLETKGHCNNEVKTKYECIKNIIKHVNNNEDVSEELILKFLKVFCVFIYDLDIKGITLALLRTVIEQFKGMDSHSTWCVIKDFVADLNIKEGTITLETIPNHIKQNFISRKECFIPQDLVLSLNTNDTIYTNLKYKKALALASLIGSWSEYNTNDKTVVSSIIDQDYESWIKILQEIEQLDNSPICYKKNIWTVKNRNEVLKHTQSTIYDNDIERLQTEIIKVLTELDPKYDLEKDRRFLANVYEKIYKYSYNLQKGLSETLALLGCRNYKFDHAENKLNYFTNNVLYAIFNNPSWQLIATLNECIPSLAESSPSNFITIINSLCNNSSIVIRQLIEEEGDGITGGCYITGLLWALERLAWSPLYLTDAILLLGKLTEIMPNGRWSNRPENSIVEILMPWHYQTLANIKIQKSTMERFVKEYPKAATQVLIKLLPIDHQIATDTDKPQYMNLFTEDWRYSINIKDRNELVSHYITLLIEQTKGNIDNIIKIINYLNILNYHDFKKVIKIMSSQKIIKTPEEKRMQLWNSLLSEVKNHKRFKNAKWAMPLERILELETVLETIKPEDPINKIVPLFNIHLNYDIDDATKDYKKVEKTLNLRRKRELTLLLKQQYNITTIINLIKKVESPYMVADALASIKQFNFDKDIYPVLLNTNNKNINEFLYTYTHNKYRTLGLKWLKKIPYNDWPYEKQAEFFKQLPSITEIWHLIDTLETNVQKTYWSTINVRPYQCDSDLELIYYLLKNSRPIAAVECINKMLHNKKDVDSMLMIKILDKIPNSDEDIHNIDVYTIGKMIKILQDDKMVDFEKLVWLEWQFYYALDHVTKPKNIERKLKEQPEFFCDLISILYKPKDTKIAKTEPIFDQKIISHAWKILNDIKPLAGYHEDTEIFDSKIFFKWFTKVVKIAKEKTRFEVTLNEIGQILFYTPADGDGFWINRKIAELLNTEEYDAMRRGYSSEIINSRGVHFVDRTATPELDFANKYRKQAEDCRTEGYNRLAKILDDAELFYKNEAERILNKDSL